LAVIKATQNDIETLARLMRAEAEGDGESGMMAVGNVMINRVLADCHDFRNITNIQQMTFQSPGGFEATRFPYFYQRARPQDIELAKRQLAGEKMEVSETALWFYNPFQTACPAQFWGQWNSGREGVHCFYAPLVSDDCYDD